MVPHTQVGGQDRAREEEVWKDSKKSSETEELPLTLWVRGVKWWDAPGARIQIPQKAGLGYGSPKHEDAQRVPTSILQGFQTQMQRCREVFGYT